MGGGRVLVDGQPLIHYHFHSFLIVGDGEQFRLASPFYRLGRRGVGLVYRPYIASLERAAAQVRRIAPAYAYGVSSERPCPRLLRLVAWAPHSLRRLRGDLRRRVLSVPILREARVRSRRLFRRRHAD